MSAGYKGDVKFVIAEEYIPVFQETDKVEGAYSFDNTTDITQLEKSSLGNDWKRFEEGLKDLSGSVNIYLTKSSLNLLQNNGLSGLLTLIAFPNSFVGKKAWIENRLNDYFSLGFSIVLESFTISTETDDRVLISVSWKGAGNFSYYEVQRTNFDLQNIENYVLQNLTNFEIQNVRDIGI